MTFVLSERDQARSGPRSLKPVGSVEWCWQTVDFFKESLRHVDEQWRQADEVLEELRSARAWEKVPPDQPYQSLNKMLLAEVGMTATKVTNQIKTAREKWGGVRRADDNGGDRRSGEFQSRGTRLKPVTESDTTDRTVARLKRDDPDLSERVLNGEITPNAAAHQKGWRKPRVVLANPETVARKIRESFTEDQIAQLIALLLPPGNDP